jgi:protein ImuB
LPCSCPNAPGFRPGARWARDAEVRLAAPAGGTPLVTAHRTGQRITLAALSREAQRLGLAPGMALTQARMLVPGLDARDSDPEADAALLARLGTFAARRWTPRAAVSGPDGLWLDLSGVAHLFGGERRMCERIVAFCARLGFSARIAVAGTLGAAYALARFGDAAILACRVGGEAEALAALPLAALRLDEPGLAVARRLGLERIGELAAMPRAPLERRFGTDLLLRLDQALGRAGEPFDPIVPADPPSVELRFVEPIATAEAIAEAMAEALGRLVVALEQAGLGARLLDFVCARIDGEEPAIRIGTARASRDRDHLLRLLAPRIETIDPGFGIERIRLVAFRVEPLGPRPITGLLDAASQATDLVPLIDRLVGRLGPRRLYRMSAVESDVPERSVRRIAPLDRPQGWPSWPRPARLLSPPERVHDVIALLPDQPPRRFTWRGRSYRVRQADGPERIHGEWWKRRAEAEAVRDYFQVEDEAGHRFWLFRRGDGEDPRTGDLGWYLHGVFG